MAGHEKIGTYSRAEQIAACERNDHRIDYEWQSDCGALILLADGDGLTVCCGGFYDPWHGTLPEAIEYLESLESED